MMPDRIPTQWVVDFLVSKGYTRIQGVSFAFCLYGQEDSVISLDEEYYWTDVSFLVIDWTQEGEEQLAEEFLAYMNKRK